MSVKYGWTELQPGELVYLPGPLAVRVWFKIGDRPALLTPMTRHGSAIAVRVIRVHPPLLTAYIPDANAPTGWLRAIIDMKKTN